MLALCPLLAGLHLPEPLRPAVVLREPTVFPTADGLWPMGATLGFLLRLREADRVPVDHNQALWRSLATVEFESGDDGFVPLHATPLRSYFELAATLRGERVHAAAEGVDSFRYVDERALLRSPAASWTWTVEERSRLEARTREAATLSKAVVSGRNEPERVLRLTGGAGMPPSDPKVERRLALAEVFGGDAFELLGPVEEVWSLGEREGRGKTMVVYSEAPFSLEWRRGADAGDDQVMAEALDYAGPGGEKQRLFFVAASGANVRDARYLLVSDRGGDIFAARSLLPDYMSVKRLRWPAARGER